MSIKIVITDDHPLAIAGLQNMLYNVPHMEVTATYTTGEGLLEGLKEHQPDVLLLDVLLPDRKGTELATHIRQVYPGIRIIALTSLDAPIHVRSMMREGCKGYALKNTDKASLVYAIKQVYDGHEYIEPSLKEKMLYNVMHYRKLATGKSPNLTHREKEILKLIVGEYTSQQIADQLFLSLRTVETHRFNLQKKLAVNNTIGLVKAAIQMGLIDAE
ncbi:MAG: response regulator transcription factor [Taibaiella sp.]|jgi:DNA-binding NarL/FixJ family response regulator